MKIARTWLRQAGVGLPRGRVRVDIGANTTFISGATGLCCFGTALVVVSWGGTRDQYGRFDAPLIVYTGNGGTVVQADVSPRGTSSYSVGSGFSSPCPGRARRDSNGVAIGAWCFYYPAAGDLQMLDSVGVHETWASDPRQIAWSFSQGSRIVGILRGPLHVVRVTPQRAMYWVRARGVTYQLTLVPAFPGLIGSIWELIKVQGSGTRVLRSHTSDAP